MNTLSERCPELLKEWDYEKNDLKNIYPDKIPYGSGTCVYWKCPNGHVWNCSVKRRTIGKMKCPHCRNIVIRKGFNDLVTRYPEIIKEWNYEKNEVKPGEVWFKSPLKVWWKCSTCGYEWLAEIQLRVKGSKCPRCSINKVRDRLN